MTLALASLRLHPQDEADLVWRFGDEWRGDCGVRSRHAAFERYVELGARVQHSFAVREFGLDEASPALQAVRRLRRIDARLSRVPAWAVDVLERVYGPTGPRRPGGLEAFVAADGLPLGGIVFASSLARAAHRRSRTRREYLDWLQRLSARLTDPARRSSRADRRRDEHLRDELVLDAEVRLVAAVRAFYASRRPEVRRAA